MCICLLVFVKWVAGRQWRVTMNSSHHKNSTGSTLVFAVKMFRFCPGICHTSYNGLKRLFPLWKMTLLCELIKLAWVFRHFRFVLFEIHLQWHFPFVLNFTNEISVWLMNASGCWFRAKIFMFVPPFSYWHVLFACSFAFTWSNGTVHSTVVAAAIEWQLIDDSVFGSSSFGDAYFDFCYLEAFSLIETSMDIHLFFKHYRAIVEEKFSCRNRFWFYA